MRTYLAHQPDWCPVSSFSPRDTEQDVVVRVRLSSGTHSPSPRHGPRSEGRRSESCDWRGQHGQPEHML